MPTSVKRLALLAVVTVTTSAWAAEHPSLAKARVLYNVADYDGAIGAASAARTDAASTDAAALVIGRSHLERYRIWVDPADLAGAREALAVVRAPLLSPPDRLDLLIGLG